MQCEACGQQSKLITYQAPRNVLPWTLCNVCWASFLLAMASTAKPTWVREAYLTMYQCIKVPTIKGPTIKELRDRADQYSQQAYISRRQLTQCPLPHRQEIAAARLRAATDGLRAVIRQLKEKCDVRE